MYVHVDAKYKVKIGQKKN